MIKKAAECTLLVWKYVKLDEPNSIVNCTLRETTLGQVIFIFFCFTQTLFYIGFDIILYELCRYAQHILKTSLLPTPEGIPPTVM